jgi:alpha-N-arabinofuranosidase
MKSLIAVVLLASTIAVLAPAEARAGEPITFEWFEYAGRDAAFTAPLPEGHFYNPILAGYYPDPSVTRVGDKYYLVNSTFAHWPGIPIHESRDLVHWTLVGHALSDASRVTFDGLEISRGVFAPSIHHHKDTFYVVNTLIGAGGNFVVTAPEARGPWSDPVWLKNVNGIDPSLFFDDDGKAYLVHNGPPEGKPQYDGHCALWLHEFNLEKLEAGPGKVLVDRGVDPSKNPVWIEGPHLYRVKDWYYLMAAEGGTERNHSEVIFRAKSPWGPFEPYKANPILTQRDLPEDRPNPVTNSGHADLIQMKDGSWWALFLASRPYEGFRYNTGRETFLLPVSWKDGWPVILEQGKPVPLSLKGPKVMKKDAASSSDLLGGNFTRRDDFDMAEPGHEWLQVHVPRHKWYELGNGTLVIHPLSVKLDEKRNPSFYARRQAHQRFAASTELRPPKLPGTAAGLAAYQNESHWYFFGTRRVGGQLQIFLERDAGDSASPVSTVTVDAPETLRLIINGNAGRYSFFYDAGAGWTLLHDNDDASILSTEVAGGFVGTVLGPYARQE